MSQYDVVMIGVGSGGYVAAIRTAQLGFKIACADTGVSKAGGAPTLGGTCLNIGCIPSKALLQSSEHFHAAQHEFTEHGITVDDVKLDTVKTAERRDAIMTRLTGGMKFLFQESKVTSLFSTAFFIGKNGDAYQIGIDNKGGKIIIGAKHVTVTTGSVPRLLPQVAIDNVNVLNNEDALNLAEVPTRLGVIGSGMAGLEIGSVWNRVGVEVTILEAAPTFLAAVDQQTAKKVFKYFTKRQGLNIESDVKVGDIKSEGKGVSVAYEAAVGETKTEVFDKLIVAIGRIPDTKGLNTEAVGLKKDERGFIKVDGGCHTNLSNVWVVGDVVRGPMLAHKTSDEGAAVVERIVDQKPHINFNNVPFVIYTDPETVQVGKTKEQLKVEGVEYKKGTSGFGANGRALAMGKAKGMVKVLADAKADHILGVYMTGPVVSELVTEGVTALELFASSEDTARVTYTHPTSSEVVHEVTLAADKRVLHG